MKPAEARKVIKDLDRAFSGVAETIPSAAQILEAIEVFQKRGASASASQASAQPLTKNIALINKQLVSDLKALSKAATRAQLVAREADRLASSISALTNVDVLPRRERKRI
ncbi:MAG TPA: hypothetical protein VFP33_07040 [Gallionella sp.]|nr:hypothetical protein [Gallionella sp.]